MLDIKKGDIVLVSSDITRLLKEIYDNEHFVEPNFLIDALQNTIGDCGTLLFPTYNWDFCKGIPFHYHKSSSQTGALSKCALKRDDFKRTKHPIYSFAVWGKYQDLLYSFENTDSFGSDSPFDFMYKYHGKNLMMDVDYQNSFTFLHYVEESIRITYRYIKNFTSVYSDEFSEKKEKIYSMYVRDLDLEVKNNINPIGEEFERQGIAQKKIINNIPFVLVDFYSTFDVIKDDIVNNRSKKIAIYKGQ
jgi:aminoglycoside 3-N-acetyltransferase